MPHAPMLHSPVMAQRRIVIPLPRVEFLERLRTSADAQEARIRSRIPTDLRIGVEEEGRFWIQWCDPRRPNQWNETLLAAPRVHGVATDQDGATRVRLTLRTRPWILGVLLAGSAAAAGLLVLILKALGVLGQRGYVYGMKTTLAYSVGALAIVLLGMTGAVLWGRPDPTPARLALLRAVGLFGAGRSRTS